LHRSEFDQLALEQLDAVYRMALQLARHPDEASDLVQETYMKALRAADRFSETGGGIRPWLFKILHNLFYTRVGKAKREGGLNEGEATIASAGPEPDQPEPAWNLADLDWEHVDQRLKEAIERLKPEYRSVLLLWGVEGMKYREIAEVQQVPIGTIMSRLHRARSILAQDLAELAEENRLSRG
jgi:RNA polymerase sigma-70 factor (ECF subfamily)